MTTTSPAESWIDAASWEAPAPPSCGTSREVSYPNRLPKRIFDLVGAAAALLIALPLLAVIAVMVRLDSKGPILYRQVRVGRDRRRRNVPRDSVRLSELVPRPLDRRRQPAAGQPFEIIKFRTMVVDAEADGARWAEDDDPRVTRVGRYLRAMHLDELPQLWNVLRGDMSLVGPRPERPVFVQRFAREMPGYRGRFTVRPGITGLAQLENGYDHSIADVYRKLDLDLEYLRSACTLTDLRLIARTVPHLAPSRHPRLD